MLNDLLNSLQRDGAITEAVFLRSFAGSYEVLWLSWRGEGGIGLIGEN